MTGESREMTLDEWVDRLPPHHGARRERDRLREAEAEIERLRAELTQRCAECESAKRFGHRIDIAGALLTKAEAERDRAREVAVWAAKRRVRTVAVYSTTRQIVWDTTDGGAISEICYDDADIYAALEEAMEGGE